MTSFCVTWFPRIPYLDSYKVFFDWRAKKSGPFIENGKSFAAVSVLVNLVYVWGQNSVKNPLKAECCLVGCGHFIQIQTIWIDRRFKSKTGKLTKESFAGVYIQMSKTLMKLLLPEVLTLICNSLQMLSMSKYTELFENYFFQRLILYFGCWSFF